MTEGGLRIFVENQKEYFATLGQQGFGIRHEKELQIIFDEFVLFLKVTRRVLSSEIYSMVAIEAFLKWKIKIRLKKTYCSSYRSKVIKLLTSFWNDYVLKSKCKPIGFDELNRLSEKCIQAMPPRYPRWPIEVRHKHIEFFAYLKKRRIRNYRQIGRQAIERFLLATQVGFYQSRSSYRPSVKGRIRFGLRQYFKYLSDRQLVKIELSPRVTDNHGNSFMDEWVVRYFDFCVDAGSLSHKTIKSRRVLFNDLANCMTRLGVSKLSEIQAHHIDTFVTSYGWQLKGLPSLYSVFRRFFKYLYLERQIERDISSLLIPPKIFAQAHIPDFLTAEEIARLFPAIRGNRRPVENLGRAVAQILLFTGLRIGEVASLRLDDIDWDKKQILIRNRKNRQDLLLPLPAPVIEAIYDYVTHVRPNHLPEKRIFFTILAPIVPMTSNTLSMSMCRYFHSCGVRGGAHRMRHTYAQNLLESGSSLAHIQSLLGQKNIDSARIYAKTSMSRMRKFVVMDHD